MRRSWIILSSLCLAACSVRNAESSPTRSLFDAQGNKIAESEANSALPAWRPLDPADGITGVGVLGASFVIVDKDVCTAFAIDTGVPSGPAYVLTNAHCNFFEHFGLDPLEAGEFRVDQATTYFASFNHFVAVPATQRRKLAFRRLAYVTESGMDLAIYEADATLAQVAGMGLQPLKLRSTRPQAGDTVRLIGVPLRTRDEDKQSLHISTCKVGGVVSLKNGIYTAPQSVKHECNSIPGFSGGPLLADDGAVVLINSHGTDDFSDDAPCTYATMPCEVSQSGETKVDRDVNYAQFVDGIARCFDAAGKFDLGQAECGLPR